MVDRRNCPAQRLHAVERHGHTTPRRVRLTPYAHEIQKQLDAAGIRVTVDDRNEKVNLKIREAQLQKIPYMLVVGDREQENGLLSVRNRKHADQGAKSIADFITEIKA